MSSTSSASLQSPSASSDAMSDSDTSVGVYGVRFDERCVLIPQCSGKFNRARQPPRMGTLELPIPVVGLPWRWPSSPSPKEEFSGIDVEGTGAAVAPSSPETQRVVLKVPYPIFRRKSQSGLQATFYCPRPCLRHSSSMGAPAEPLASNQKESQGPRGPKKRSNSLPPFPSDKSIETVPLRPCCEKCLAACKTHWQKKGLPTLEESSREHTPSQSRVNLNDNEECTQTPGEEENWCAGLHFTKGALRLWRSASADSQGFPRHSQEGSGLLGSLVRVDEVDRKRGTSPNPSPCSSTSASMLKPPLTLSMREIERVKGSTPPSRSPSGSDEPEEDLFPLPSPKRSPAASPADSATCLPVQVPPTEPRRLEAAIKAKMAEREKAKSAYSSSPLASARSSPIPIPSSKGGVSHFRSHLDEIEYDPTLPDPDALPPTSTILLDSPPSSPTLGPSSPGRIPHFSSSLPSLHLHKREPQLISPPNPRNTPAAVVSLPPAPPIPEQDASPLRPANRRPSISNIMRAGVSVLRGISLTAQTGLDPPLPPRSLSRSLLA